MARINGRHAAFPMFTNETILRNETYTLFVTHTAPSWRGSVFYSLLPRDREHAVYDGIERGNIANPNDPTNSRAESDAWAKANRAAMSRHFECSETDRPHFGEHVRIEHVEDAFAPILTYLGIIDSHVNTCDRLNTCGICGYFFGSW